MRKARFSMLARNRSSARACSRIGSSTDVRAPSSHRKVDKGPENAGRLAEAGIDGPREERYSIQQRPKGRSVDERGKRTQRRTNYDQCRNLTAPCALGAVHPNPCTGLSTDSVHRARRGVILAVAIDTP